MELEALIGAVWGRAALDTLTALSGVHEGIEQGRIRRLLDRALG